MQYEKYFRCALASIVIAFAGCSGGANPVTPAAYPRTAQVAQNDALPSSVELVYVADASGPLAAYSATSSGAVHPAFTIPDPMLANGYWGPWGVTFDSGGNIYVQTFLSDATSYVFGARSHRFIRAFMGGGPDTRSLAVDSKGYEYIATSEQGSMIAVMLPGASGSANNLYEVNPVRSFFTDEAAFFPWPSILTVDSHDDLVAALVRNGPNAIEIFAGGAHGSDTPFRVISGSRTRLGNCLGNPCNNMAVTFSPRAHEFYVGVFDGVQTRILVFAEDATGNVAPRRTIEGNATRLSGDGILGLAVSQRTGELYAMVNPSQFLVPGRVLVFSASACGNARPIRSFEDASTKFVNAGGIAIR